MSTANRRCFSASDILPGVSAPVGGSEEYQRFQVTGIQASYLDARCPRGAGPVRARELVCDKANAAGDSCRIRHCDCGYRR